VDAVPAALGLSGAEIAAVLEAAGRAPSLHNSQPWAFRVLPGALELHADPNRRVPVADPDDRELRIACGAALFTLRLALRGRGVRPAVSRFPDRDRPGLLAVVRRGGPAAVTPGVTRLLAAVPRRRTNRHPFTDVPVAPHQRRDLFRAATAEGGALRVVDDPAGRRRLQELARVSHRRQVADPAFRAEFASWTGRGPGGADGVPVASSGPRPAAHDPWALRDFAAGTGPDRLPGKDFEAEPLIAVLAATRGGAWGDLQAGEALQHVLLVATAEGLAVSYFSNLTEVPDVRAAVHELVGTTRPPQVVLRVGHGWPTVSTPRRPVADLLRVPDGADAPQR
jgi:nitroreductase